MRILTIAGPLHREFGGPPMAATGIASSLSTMGNVVEILVCGQTTSDINLNSYFFAKLNQSKVVVQILKRRRVSKYGTLIRITELKSIWNKIRRTDIVVLHQIFELQYIVIIPILILQKKPYVVMPHGTLTTYQRQKHRIRKLIFHPLTYFFLKFSRAIFVATEQEKNQLPKYLEDKSINVGLGIEMDFSKHEKVKVPNKSFTLLYMGRVTRKKRLDIALEAFSIVSKQSKTPMKFIVCGTGEEREMIDIRDFIRTMKIGDIVELRGWVDFTEKKQAFLASDCFILTSEDENFAIAAAEALAYGIPCVLSKKVALASLVTKYRAGIVFDDLNPHDVALAISELSRLDQSAAREAAFLAASELRWDQVAQRWDSNLKCLLQI